MPFKSLWHSFLCVIRVKIIAMALLLFFKTKGLALTKFHTQSG